MMSDDVEDLLPSPAAVRCALHLDLSLVITGLVHLAERNDINERALLQQVQEVHSANLLRKLTDVVPLEELHRAAHGNRLDMLELVERLPFVRVIWAMESAEAALDAADLLTKLDQQKSPQPDADVL
jgi:hypothetical protein